MNPTDAIKLLKSLRWSDERIGQEVKVTGSAIRKYRLGTSPSYDTGMALIAVAKKEQARIKREEARYRA